MYHICLSMSKIRAPIRMHFDPYFRIVIIKMKVYRERRVEQDKQPFPIRILDYKNTNLFSICMGLVCFRMVSSIEGL